MVGEVHLHYRLTDVVQEADYRISLGLLSEDERGRAARFVFAADRERFVIAHALLRRSLSEHADVTPEAWAFTANEFGKPALAKPFRGAGLSFNLSHTDGLVACAVGSQDLGVDVESIDRRVRVLDVASRFFSASEIAWLSDGSEADRQARFLNLWTLKEAYVKGVGTGLSHPLDTFGFAFEDPARLRFDAPPSDAASWQFDLFAPSSRHRLALAVRCDPTVSAVRVHDGTAERPLAPIFSTRRDPRRSVRGT